jgi:23S rRNA (uridine2552-2'-O)-methyltransferase
MRKYQDHYFKRAKQDNYPARSVYKLQEIDKRFQLLKKRLKVLDLGAAPGSWTLLAAKRVGPEGCVVALDLQDTDTAFPDNVRYFQADATDPGPEVLAVLEETAPFDLVISDMAPKTSGITFKDQFLSYELCLTALSVAEKWLAPGGGFVAKIFEGPEVKDFEAEVRKRFKVVKRFKPKSSRDESKEFFYVAQGFKGGA